MNIMFVLFLVLCCMISYLLGHRKGFFLGLNKLSTILDDVSDFLTERDKKNPS